MTSSSNDSNGELGDVPQVMLLGILAAGASATIQGLHGAQEVND